MGQLVVSIVVMLVVVGTLGGWAIRATAAVGPRASRGRASCR